LFLQTLYRVISRIWATQVHLPGKVYIVNTENALSTHIPYADCPHDSPSPKHTCFRELALASAG
jgi:hypothetical protein